MKIVVLLSVLSLSGCFTYVTADTPCGKWTVIDSRSQTIAPQARCTLADGTKIGAGADSAVTDLQVLYQALGAILGAAK